MKILIVRMWSDNLNIHSYNCQEIGLAKALIKQGNICDIVLYTSEIERQEKFYFDNNSKYITIYYLNAKTILKNTFYGKKLYDICKKYDCIQSAEYDQIGNLVLSRKFRNFCIYHGPYKSSFTKGYNKKAFISDVIYYFFPQYKDVPIISKSNLATDLLKKKNFKKINTIGVGIDLEKFDDVNKKENENIKVLSEQKKYLELKYILYIGKIEKRRNIEFILNRLKDVSDKNQNTRLILVGNGEKNYLKHIFKLSKKMKIYDKIIYFPQLSQEELPNLYKISDVFLLPTKYEIFGMVLLEAMHFGTPIITTLNGGSSTLIEHEQNGFIYDLKDIDKWNDCINKIIIKEEYKKNISKKSAETVDNSFTWDVLAEKFLKTYKEICKK